MNIAAALSHVCAGMRIHAIDIVQPPGMAMPPDIEWQSAIVPAALAMKSNADVTRNARSLINASLLSIGRGAGPTPARTPGDLRPALSERCRGSGRRC